MALFSEPFKTLFIKNQPFTTRSAADLLSLSLKETAKILYRYKKQGHLLMLKRGIYLPVAHKGLSPEEVLSDPWLIVSVVFQDSAIGGWSAAHFFGLTDQLFQDTCLISSNAVAHTKKKVGRFRYRLFKSCISGRVGRDEILRSNIKVPISDVHRTVIDMLENPECGGGIQNTIDCLKVYFAEHYDEKIFISYMQRIRNGVFFKRLGYIVEALFAKDHVLCAIARQRMTKGYSSIDTSISCDTLISRWNLYINKGIVI